MLSRAGCKHPKPRARVARNTHPVHPTSALLGFYLNSVSGAASARPGCSAFAIVFLSGSAPALHFRDRDGAAAYVKKSRFGVGVAPGGVGPPPPLQSSTARAKSTLPRGRPRSLMATATDSRSSPSDGRRLMSHSQFHRIEAHTEACTAAAHQAQKLETDSWPQSVDFNTHLRF